MIPKKKRRTIVVNNIEYEYSVTGHYDKSIFIRNLSSKKSKSYFIDGELKICPSHIREAILEDKI